MQSIAFGLIIFQHKNIIMIFDRLENAVMYRSISENLEKGFEFLKNTNLLTIESGRYEIKDNDVFALISEYDSKSHQDCRLEAHHTYTDIQYIVSGREAIGFATPKNQEVTVDYNPEKDIVFFTGDSFPLILEAGMFAVFFPQELHRPCMQIDGPENVKKVVIKVRV